MSKIGLVIFVLYSLISSLIAFSLMWLADEIRRVNRFFMTNSGQAMTWPIICVAVFWPVAAPIAFGIFMAAYVRCKKEKV